MRYLNVAINLPVKNIFKTFTYKVPPQLDFLKEGWRVVVPFGHQLLEGFVVEETAKIDDKVDYKEIVDVLGTEPWFNAEMLATAEYLAKYYMCSLAEALRLFIPGKKSIATVGRYTDREDFTGSLTSQEEGLLTYLQLKGPQLRKDIVKLDKGEETLKSLITKQAVALEYEIKYKIKNRTVRTFAITAEGCAALAQEDKRIKAQNIALQYLRAKGESTVPELTEEKISAQTLRTLAAKGWAVEGQKRVLRDSYKDKEAKKEIFQLTDEQQKVLQAVGTCFQANCNKTFLLQGITGSGKTEVYLRLADKTLRAGKQVLVLVPEIALTGQIVKRFKAWFGSKVAVAHSKLSAGERADVWQKMRSDYASVLIGVRSAVFSPFANLGLIIIDEEHEYTYKQDERPNYHARNIAAFRAKYNKAPLVLGSATPDLESYYKAQKGIYEHLVLTKRPMAGAHLPKVDIVDMRKELQEGNKSVLSNKLQSELLATVQAGEQAIVLLNRRGFSTFVMCRDCGTTLTCPNCAVSLVYHEKSQMMQCHYCGHTEPVPRVCPHCQSKRIKFFGTGTEKAEAEIAALGNGIKPIRMDQDSTMAKFAHEEILGSFVKGKFNVLLGTQMVAKGHDIPNVTLVGVLSADSQLNLPDYRSGERTFALLTQAAGRAGRGEKPGRVVFQAYDAQNPILTQAASQNYNAFAENELAVRRELGYPPFTSLLKITVIHKEQAKALETAQQIVNFLEGEQLAGKLLKTQIMGPFPAIIAMVNNIYRINIIIKSTEPEIVKRILWHSKFKDLANVYFDVDPVNVI